MESVGSIKRKRAECSSFNSEKCVVCQNGGKDGIRKATSQGLHTLKQALSTRINYNCHKYLSTIDLLQSGKVDLSGNTAGLVWHKNCFSSFTSATHLDRLKRRFESSLSTTSATSGSSSKALEDESPESQRTISRSTVPAVQWDKCIYCQTVTKAKVHQILTLETSDKILSASKIRLHFVMPIIRYI